MLWSVFSAISPIYGKKGVFLKYQCYDRFFQNLDLFFSQKRHFYANFFGESILKNHNIGRSLVTLIRTKDVEPRLTNTVIAAIQMQLGWTLLN
jgi:hypothetical protein